MGGQTRPLAMWKELIAGYERVNPYRKKNPLYSHYFALKVAVVNICTAAVLKITNAVDDCALQGKHNRCQPKVLSTVANQTKQELSSISAPGTGPHIHLQTSIGHYLKAVEQGPCKQIVFTSAFKE